MSNTNLDNIISEIGSRYYKVGSVLITSTNTNPQSVYGGTWQLIRKRFAEKQVTDAFTFDTTNTQNASSECRIYKDSIICRIIYRPKVAFNDDAKDIATFDPTKLGITSTSYMYTNRVVAVSDGLNAMNLISLADTGTLKSYDVITKTTATSVAANSSYGFSATFPLMYSGSTTSMIDSFCDEFWWVRTA